MAKIQIIRPAALTLLLLLAAAGSALSEECGDCHVEVSRQFRDGSHHVQGVAATGHHCYQCHWEAASDGRIDPRYHQRNVGSIDLVVWSAGVRPSEYRPGETAFVYSPAVIGTGGEREALAQISRHCLSCHNDTNKSIRPFPGDSNSPGSYAWDGSSIASRYLDKSVTRWGKYSTATSNRKQQVVKAFSAHGNSTGNQGGWNAGSGYDGEMPVLRGGTVASNVECFDCHNSHGSAVPGITSSYPSHGGASRGGILKETAAGKGGYRMTYSPSANTDPKSSNPYSAGAGLCFDCHETAAPGKTPWGYGTTFGAAQPVLGYKDTSRFGPGMKASTSRHAERQQRTEIISSHLKAGSFLNYSAVTRINGLCTPCHDPHGVSPTLGASRQYAVPLLKGSWLTSPYREDAAPGKGSLQKPAGGPTANVTGSARGPMSMQGMQYNIDRNTFGPDKKIRETDSEFAGLCLKCHPRVKPTGETRTDRIHRSVKGWGNNKEHAFPCAKCHQAHNSGLPRLMQTNCFHEGPANMRENSGLAWLPENKAASGAVASSQTSGRKTGGSELVGCHVRQFGKKNATSSQEPSSWNRKSGW